jgi:hypothetical protein
MTRFFDQTQKLRKLSLNPKGEKKSELVLSKRFSKSLSDIEESGMEESEKENFFKKLQDTQKERRNADPHLYPEVINEIRREYFKK